MTQQQWWQKDDNDNDYDNDDNCDNIHSWISTTGDLAFSHQQEFTVLHSQKGSSGSFDSFDSFDSFTKLKHPKTNPWNRCPLPLHSHGSMPCTQSDILKVYQTQFHAKLQKQI